MCESPICVDDEDDDDDEEEEVVMPFVLSFFCVLSLLSEECHPRLSAPRIT